MEMLLVNVHDGIFRCLLGDREIQVQRVKCSHRFMILWIIGNSINFIMNQYDSVIIYRIPLVCCNHFLLNNFCIVIVHFIKSWLLCEKVKTNSLAHNQILGLPRCILMNFLSFQALFVKIYHSKSHRVDIRKSQMLFHLFW